MLRRRHLQRGEHLVRLDAEASRDLRDRRGPAELVLQLLRGAVDPDQVLLQPSRHAHRPGAVAEVPADLPGDGRRGERAELVLQRGIESLDRLDQTDEAHLLDVLERLPSVGKAAGDVVDEIAVQLDQALTDARVAGGPVLAEQTLRLVTFRARRRLGQRALPRRRAAAPRRRRHETRYLVSRTRSPPVRSSTR